MNQRPLTVSKMFHEILSCSKLLFSNCLTFNYSRLLINKERSERNYIEMKFNLANQSLLTLQFQHEHCWKEGCQVRSTSLKSPFHPRKYLSTSRWQFSSCAGSLNITSHCFNLFCRPSDNTMISYWIYLKNPALQCKQTLLLIVQHFSCAPVSHYLLWVSLESSFLVNAQFHASYRSYWTILFRLATKKYLVKGVRSCEFQRRSVWIVLSIFLWLNSRLKS